MQEYYLKFKPKTFTKNTNTYLNKLFYKAFKEVFLENDSFKDCRRNCLWKTLSNLKLTRIEIQGTWDENLKTALRIQNKINFNWIVTCVFRTKTLKLIFRQSKFQNKRRVIEFKTFQNVLIAKRDGLYHKDQTKSIF